ncbi:enolase-phosphatase E1 [Drosophila nasuta]|uniref:enolase-phosphatase E1 n=1 Tax=Drosophila nasuta TaxID=42062 RepID=UPI00295EEB6F|nr:enolase-phosphatase E1 [Drosophila nasuta]
MPESDVTKMKVADLKRELKLRGLPLNGNKNELQDRLQTALLEGDISLDDSAIAEAIADGIDDDVSLTDEDEHKLLGDEHEDLLLKSPVSTPTTTSATLPELLEAVQSKAETDATSPPTKKIVLKRNNSQQQTTTLSTVAATPSKENAAPAAETTIPNTSDTEEKATAKTPRKPIVISGTKDATPKAVGDKKVGELSSQERLAMRAKKFGITVAAKDATAAASKSAASTAAAASPVVNKSSSASIKANNGNKETDEQQKEALKRRAERFGCVVPEKSPKTTADEKLQKRKERFGGGAATNTTATSPTDVKGQGEWAEKARARLERFKTTPAVAATPAAAAATTADATK